MTQPHARASIYAELTKEKLEQAAQAETMAEAGQLLGLSPQSFANQCRIYEIETPSQRARRAQRSARYKD
jgi:predicted O-methyltransferase YrrM